MGLGDLTSRDAVLEAIAEYDELGRDAFLQTYGFGRSRTYYLEYDGKRYDSKAIVGSAHGHQHGTPLRADQFSGGDSTVAARLTALGFTVTNPDPTWETALGQVMTRTQVKDLYGGSIFGGIEPSNTTPNIMIYTDPEQGALNGYDYDGWDDEDASVFYYTGEGRRGDQTIREGNKAIVEQAQTGRTLRLFEALDKKRRRGGKRQRYLGAFQIDPTDPYRFEPAPDADGNPRQVIVFRLLRDEVAVLPTQPAPSVDDGQIPGTPNNLRRGSPTVELVPAERNLVREYEVSPPRTGTRATREEASLVDDFETWLRAKGHETQRALIRIPDEHSLVTDTFDTTIGVLYEAKSSADRATVRLAIGQLIDYLRFIPGTLGSLLLPQRPSPDVVALIESCGFGLVYRGDDGAWVTLEPATP